MIQNNENESTLTEKTDNHSSDEIIHKQGEEQFFYEQVIDREKILRATAEAAEARLQDILASIHEDFVVIDRQWRITYLNPQAAATMQMSVEAMLNQNIWELLPDLVDTEFYHQTHHAMTHRVPLQFEFYYTPLNAWFENRVYPTADGIIHLCSNITERKRLEAELHQKTAILELINQHIPTPIFVKNRQGQIIYANPATLKVLGKTAIEVIGATDQDLYPHWEDAAKVMANDQRIMGSGQGEVVEESPDGIRTFLSVKAPYYDDTGEVIGLIGISNDISDRVQLERDRERVLQQEKAARFEAERNNRIKNEFLLALSHELRSPLNPILGWSKLLLKGKMDEAKTQQALITIERNAKLQAEMVEDLLDIAHILQGNLTLEVDVVDVVPIVQAAIDSVRIAATAKSITLETAGLELSPAKVIGDAARLRQIVWNLLGNAVKFTPEGGKVRVQLTKFLAQNNPQVQIAITDTGKGILPEFLPHVFDYFRQEDGATTRHFGGLGLGLTIVRHLTELHGGTVQAMSLGEGLGATFTLTLPINPTLEGRL
jgi:PAS domain S-box-containing protein